MTKSYEWEKKIAKGVSSKYGKTAREKAYAVLRANGLSDDQYTSFAQKANNNKELNARPKLYQWEKDMASGISTKVASASRDRVDKMLLANGATPDNLPLIRKHLNERETQNIADTLKAQQDARAKAENDARLADTGDRGFLDRTFDALSIGQYASANLVKAGMRDDYSAGDALKDAVKAANPFGKGYKRGEGTYSDVLKEAGWNPTSTAGKIARGFVGLTGDVLLDPTTYLTLGGGAIAKGTGKVAIKSASTSLLKNMAEKYGVKALEQVSHIDDFIKLKPELKKIMNDDELRLLHRSVQFALNPRNIDNAKKLIRTQDAVRGVTKSSEDVTKYANQLVDNTLKTIGVNKEGKASFGLSNAPFMHTLTRGASDKLTFEFSNKYAGKIGDALHISNAYNGARKAIYGSRIATLFSSKAKNFQDLQIAPSKLYDLIQVNTITKGLDARKLEDEVKIREYAKDLLKLSDAESKQVIELMQDPSVFEPVKKMVQFANTEMFKTNKRQLRKELDVSKSKLARLQIAQTQISELEKKIAKTPTVDLKAELQKLVDARDKEIDAISTMKIKSNESRQLLVDSLRSDLDKMGEEGKVLKTKLDEHLAKKPILPDVPVKKIVDEPIKPQFEGTEGNFKISLDELTKLHEDNKLRVKPKNPIQGSNTKQLTKDEIVGRLNGLINGKKISHLEGLGKDASLYKISSDISDEKLDELFTILNNPKTSLEENIKQASGKIVAKPWDYNGTSKKINSYIAKKLDYKDFDKEIFTPRKEAIKQLEKATDEKEIAKLEQKIADFDKVINERVKYRAQLQSMTSDELDKFLSSNARAGETIDEVINEIDDVESGQRRVEALIAESDKKDKLPYAGLDDSKKFNYAKKKFAESKQEIADLVAEKRALEFKKENLLNPPKKQDLEEKIKLNRERILKADKKLNQLERALDKHPELQDEYNRVEEVLNKLKSNREKMHNARAKFEVGDKDEISALTDQIKKVSDDIEGKRAEIKGVDYNDLEKPETVSHANKIYNELRKNIRLNTLRGFEPIKAFNNHVFNKFNLTYNEQVFDEIQNFARDILSTKYSGQKFMDLKPATQELVVTDAVTKYFFKNTSTPKLEKAFKESGRWHKLKELVEKKEVEKLTPPPVKQTSDEKLLDTIVRARTARNTEVDQAYSKAYEAYQLDNAVAETAYKTDLAVFEKQMNNTSLSEWEEANRSLSAQVDDLFTRQDKVKMEIAKVKTGKEHDDLIHQANARFEEAKEKLLKESKQASIYQQQINSIKAEYATDMKEVKQSLKSIQSQIKEIEGDKGLREALLIKKNNLLKKPVGYKYTEEDMAKLSKVNKKLGTRYAKMDVDKALSELDEITTHLRKYESQFQSRLATGMNIDEAVDNLTKRVNEIDKALTDNDALEAYLRTTYGDDSVEGAIASESKDFTGKIVLDDDTSVPEKVKEIVKQLDKAFFDIGDKETMVGHLSPEQFDAMKHKYVTHVLTYEGKQLLKKKDIKKRFGVSGDMIGFGEEFNNFGLERTLVLPDGNGGVFKPTIQQANDFFAPMLKGNNFFSDTIGEIYRVRALKHNELMYDNEYMKNMLHTFGNKVSFQSIKNPPVGTKTVMNIGLLRENVAQFARTWLKEQREQGNAYTWEMGLQEALSRFHLELKHIQNEAMPFVELDAFQAKQAHAILNDGVFHVSDTIVDKVNQARKFSIERDQKRFLQTYDKFVYWTKLMQTTVAPSFHARNKVNNMFNAWMSGASGANKYTLQKQIWHLLKNEGKSTEKILVNGGKVELQELYDLAIKHGVLDNNMFARDFDPASAQEGILSFIKNRELDPTNTLSTKGFKGFEIGSHYGSRIENQDRLAQFIIHLNQGKTPEEAADLVNNFLFDYSDVTLFEQRIMKRIFPYYTFMKKNSILQLQNLIERPGKMSLVAKIMRSPEGMLDDKDKVNRNYVSAFAKNWVQTPFFGAGVDHQGNPTREPIMLSPNMSFMQLDNLPNPMKPLDSAINLFTQTTMPIKTPVELATNKNFFFDSPISAKEFDNPKKKEGEPHYNPLKMIGDYAKYVGYQTAPISQVGQLMEKEGLDNRLQMLNMAGLKTTSYDYEMSKYLAQNKEAYENGTMPANKRKSYENYLKQYQVGIDKPLNSIRDNTDFGKIKQKYYSHVEGIAKVTNKWLTNQTLTEKEKDTFKPFISILNTFSKDEAKNKQFVGALFNTTSFDKLLLGKDFVKANVTKVLDGDTVEIMYKGKKERVRMLLIDTPEIAHTSNEVAMPLGNEARDVATSMLNGKNVQLVIDAKSSRDIHGRLLAYLAVDGQDYNNYLLSQGLAGVRYSAQAKAEGNAMNLKDYKATQKSAYQKKLGIWGVKDYADINRLDEEGFNHDKEYYRKEALKKMVKR